MSERIELSRRARVLALDDATPPAEQSAEWAIENGARSERDAERDVRTIWRDDRGPFPRTVATIAGRRTMASPVSSSIDIDASDAEGGYALLAGITGDETSAPRQSTRPSGATKHHGRSEQGEALAHHETRARRSRKGRTTFDVLQHHKRPRPVTSEPSGLDGKDSLGLIAIADMILRASGADVVDIAGTTGDGKPRRSYLLGTDASSSQWAHKVTRDRSARDDYNVAIHHAELLDPFRNGRTTYGRNVVLVVHGHRGVVHAGAVRPSGSKRAAWRPTIWHTSELIADSHVPAPTVRPETKLSWPRRIRIRGSARKGERASFERLTSGQYVREVAGRAPSTGYGALARFTCGARTEVHAWNADVRRETEHAGTVIRDDAGRMVDRRRARVAVGSAPSESAWIGHALTDRPSVAITPKRTERGKANRRQGDRTPADAPTMTDEDAERIVRDAVDAGTLTMVPRSQGRLSVTHRRADGTVHTWRARNVRAVAARIVQ